MKRRVVVAVLFLLSVLSAEFAWADKLMLPHHMRDLSERTQIWRSKLPKEDLDAIVRLLSKDVDPEDCVEDEKPQTRRKIVRSFRIEKVQLTADDKNQYLVQGWGSCDCSAVGNCSFWVLEKRGKGFAVLLSDGGFNGFSVEDTNTSGYKDLIFSSHDSAASYDLRVFRFHRRGYILSQCAFVDYWNSARTGTQKKPEISRVDCR